ncbi:MULTISPECIES: terminase large subunit [unclassified Paenibacillus]|uniref:terminase large subunit n=1 Tax=unclassified Paenibacillus TaxID=185978 RepID=UPI0009A6A519|nr:MULTISPECIES: terminase TerL endonuclease subunit [unclassified Paenibacillus]SLJ98189.1 Phage terminase-like protein, large subunit, contains N-terminal HTH domain [Paenibacillus sp. RU5A]SOC66804.1 Phage terminase-like protein, large subunit, contains N-terminal HTH domain [Paenibacillus sp. RU26A]SOC70047.1 Phage terminase-like protein, large subunit, contains N-terminal HTH domain [Paenibacillus sp. RU5M]
MIKQYLIDYSRDVIDGHVVACQKHIWACMRFLKDIGRENTPDFPFVFDEDKAMRFFEWMNLFRHTKGPLQGQRIVPHEIQYFIFGNIYGWVHVDTGFRRFRYAYWQVGRKNAKSQSLACVASYEAAAMGEGMAEVYCAATKKEQAKIVWNETKVMLEQCPELKGKFKTSYGVIRHIKSDSIVQALSKEDGKKGDGFNPQCGIVDEWHAHETTEIYDVIDSGMISRSQPLMMIITTAGKNLNSPCYRIDYDMVSRLLDPNDDSTENDEYFAMVNELDKDEDGKLIDDVTDESVWEKPNPIAASHEVGRDSIRKRLKNALNAPEKMDDFLTKNMNVWVSGGEKKYMRMEAWNNCGTDTPPDVRGVEAFVGVDMSMKTDLSSAVFEFVLPDGRYFLRHRSFIPADTLEQKKKTDKVPYDLWVEKGWLEVIPGPVVDQTYIENWIVEKSEEWGCIVKEICYDPYQATQFAIKMSERGYEIVEIRQGIQTLSEPIKGFRELVLQKKIVHEHDHLLTWAMGNAVLKVDQKENVLLDKTKSTNRIDPVAATIDAHVRAVFGEPKMDVSEFATNELLSQLWGD